MNKCELDYYAILNVPRDATKQQITLAYRNLAIRFYPHNNDRDERDFPASLLQYDSFKDNHHMDGLNKYKKWQYVNMAFDILGNDMYRSVYDNYGEDGLFKGVCLPNGYFPPYQYKGDSIKIFNSVFGTYSTCANLLDAITHPPNLCATTTTDESVGVCIKPPPVEKIIYLELKEVRFGTVKRMKIMRDEFIDCKHTRTEKREKILLVKIRPGTMAGTKYTFESEGDRSPTTIPADIIFITADMPHDVFKRCNGCDLLLKHDIDLCQALIGFRFAIKTLDERKLLVSITDVVHPEYSKVIPGEGLPVCLAESEFQDNRTMQPKELGALIIKFNVKYPTYIPRELICKVKKLFDEIPSSDESTMGERETRNSNNNN